MNSPLDLPTEGRKVVLYMKDGSSYLAYRGKFLGWTGRKDAWLNYLGNHMQIKGEVAGWNGMPTPEHTIE